MGSVTKVEDEVFPQPSASTNGLDVGVSIIFGCWRPYFNEVFEGAIRVSPYDSSHISEGSTNAIDHCNKLLKLAIRVWPALAEPGIVRDA